MGEKIDKSQHAPHHNAIHPVLHSDSRILGSHDPLDHHLPPPTPPQPPEIIPTQPLIDKTPRDPPQPSPFLVIDRLPLPHRRALLVIHANPLVRFPFPRNGAIDREDERADAEVPDGAEEAFGVGAFFRDVELEEEGRWSGSSRGEEGGGNFFDGEGGVG